MRRSLGKNHWIAFKSATPVIHRRALKILFRSPETHPGLFLPGQKTSNYRAGSLFLIFFKKKKKKKSTIVKKRKRGRDGFNVPARQGGLRNFLRGRGKICSLPRRKNLLSLPPKSSHVKWAGRTSPGRGEAGRCEVACLNALRTFSCSEKSDSAPLSPSFFSPNSLVFKGGKKSSQ